MTRVLLIQLQTSRLGAGAFLREQLAEYFEVVDLGTASNFRSPDVAVLVIGSNWAGVEKLSQLIISRPEMRQV